jgi:hypothetical protein
MPKKTLVEGRVLDKWLNNFYKANAPKKEKFIDSIRKTSPGLANALDSWESSFVDLLNATKKVKEKHNQDTTEVDKLIKIMKGS